MGDQEDRDAILRRRGRLIALALGGLTGVAGCDEPAVAPPTPPEVVEAAEEGAVAEAPMVPVPAAPAPPPDGIVATRAVPAASVEAEADPEERRHAERLKERIQAPPRPCLSVMPAVCLSPMFKTDDPD